MKQWKKDALLTRLQKGVVLGAEGYIFELERRGYVKAGAYVPEVVIDYPEAVLELHREFARAGAEVTVALTYYAHRSKLRIVGRERDLETLNRQALRLAKKAAQEYDTLVAGNICNTWTYSPTDRKSHTQVAKMYQEQVKWAVEEGADFIIAETLEYVGEARIALAVIKEFGLPALVTFAATYKESKDSIAWDQACRILEQDGADVVGLNCIRGPRTMLPLLKKIRKTVSCPIAAQPVPYATTPKLPSFQFLIQQNGTRAFPIALESHLLTRFAMADFARKAQQIGVNYIGICCGGAPYHVRAMAEILSKPSAASKYSPDLTQHGMLGSKNVVKTHEAKFLRQWKN